MGELFEGAPKPLAPAQIKPVLTVVEVAAELRCSKAHVHNLINGKVLGIPPLPSLRIGRRRIIRLESLRNWLLANERAGGTV